MPVPFLLLLGAAAGVAAGVAIGRKGAGRRTAPAVGVSAAPAQYGNAPDTHSVRVGDEVVLQKQPGRVVATIGFTQEGESWTAVCVDRAGLQEWVTCVQRATGLEVCHWRKVALSLVHGGPEAQQVRHDDRTFVRSESGTARYDAHGEVDLPEMGMVSYVDFADGEHRLSFENYDGSGWEASVGRVLAPGGFAPR